VSLFASCPIIIAIFFFLSFWPRFHISGFLSLAYVIQYDVLQFHSFSCKQHNLFLLYSSVVFHCVKYHILFYPFISCWAPRLTLALGYCEEYCNKHGCAGVPLICWLTHLQMYAQEWCSRVTGRPILSYLITFHANFRSGWTNLHIPTNSVGGLLSLLPHILRKLASLPEPLLHSSLFFFNT
jgi:hypothetical protein